MMSFAGGRKCEPTSREVSLGILVFLVELMILPCYAICSTGANSNHCTPGASNLMRICTTSSAKLERISSRTAALAASASAEAEAASAAASSEAAAAAAEARAALAP